MAQPILKRKLNPLLLISTVAALALLAGVSVIAQDRISNISSNLNEAKQNSSELQKKVKSLQLGKKNKSNDIDDLEDQVKSLRSEKNNLTEKIERKDEKIQELENQETDLSGLEDSGRDKLREINKSLEEVCILGAPFGGESPVAAENACQEWGHEAGG